MTLRIIVTGSRDWSNFQAVRDGIAWHWGRLMVETGDTGGLILIHGACPTGADRAADELGMARPDITITRYHAQWERYGRAAGPVRNQMMVGDGADACLAFIRRDSRGATRTARMAEKAGIPTYRYTTED